MKELCNANEFVRDQGNIDVSDFVKSQKEFTDAARELAEEMQKLREAIAKTKFEEE